MNQAVLVNKIRQSTTQPTGSDCQACPTAGLPILPVRYAVVPKALPGYALPASCSNPLLDGEDGPKVVIQQSRYALRTLRAGFLYLHYKNPGSGAWIWQCFMISPNGALREIPIGSAAPVVPSEPACTSAVHNINSSIIALKHPEKIDKAYIGYSEHFWSSHTRKQHEKNQKSRLTAFSPAAWMLGQAQQNAAPIETVGHTVVEYSTVNLERHFKTSFFDYRGRSGQAPGLKSRMEKINPGRGMILAVPDPIGCISELNSSRMHAKADYQKYVLDKDNAWRLSCAAQIDGLRSYVEAQTKETLKDAKPKYISSGGGMVPGTPIELSRDDQIQGETRSALGRLEKHYSESSRKAFLKTFDEKCAAFQARVLALDKDYVAWKESTTLALVIADYDKVPHFSCAPATEVHSRILAGGVISAASLKSWETLLKREATDLKNYAVAGILFNQQKWQSSFKSADEKNIVEHIWGDNHGKLFDVGKNVAEADISEHRTLAYNQGINKAAEWAADLLVTINGAIMAVITDAAKRAGKAADDAAARTIAQLETMQVKLGLAYSHLHAGTSVILVQIDLTVDDWHHIMSSQLRKSMENVSKQVSKSFAAMALAAELRIPMSSGASGKLVSFTFWMSGSVDDLTRIIASIGIGVGDGAAGATKAAAKGAGAVVNAAGKVGTTAARGVAGGMAAGMRTIRVIGHTFPKGAAILAKIPAQVSATSAGRFATQLSRNSVKALSAADVKLAGPALAFQLFALRKSMDDFDNSVGFKHQDAAWAIASSAMGVTSAAVDLAGKAWKAARPGASVLGARVTAAIIIKGAGFLGAGASAVDCVQAIIRVNTMAKRGDKDAALIHGGIALAAAGATYAGVAMALGSSAFFGPVGILIACIGIGLFLTYLAFFAEDTAIGIWLDRCKFGNADRPEGPFANRQHEMDGLELVARKIVVEIEWLDKPFSSLRFNTDEIAISVKRNTGASDAMLLGLLIEGKSGTRQVFIRQHGFGTGTARAESTWPQKIARARHANGFVGKDFEAKRLHGESGIKPLKENEQAITAWEEVVELDPEKFDRATIWLRYFPDKNNELAYYDDELMVADDSNDLRDRNKQEKLRVQQ